MSSPSALIRCFLALYPDDAARGAFGEYVTKLRKLNPTVRWEKEPHIHITLKFIGDIERSAAQRVAAHIKARLSGAKAIDAVVSVVGAFPNMRHPRVIWLGFREPVPELVAMQRAIDDMAYLEGVSRDRTPFSPHFTIGRVKEYSRIRHLYSDIEANPFEPVPVTFTSMRVMESTLTPAGAIHTELGRLDLPHA
ncbi:MAG: RNA 2',3'-cyclic phosphodiesterase [Ignavibacteria bacterium]|nr:RNA 2',3'-cyclic phosphodiesterase [Ignavibacteria bacterium]